MKFRELPSEDTLSRLVLYAFAREGADQSAFLFCKAVGTALEFFHSQRTKLFQQYGASTDTEPDKLEIKPENRHAFYADMKKLLDSKIQIEIPNLDLEESDFLAENCRKPQNIDSVLSTGEKITLIKLATNQLTNTSVQDNS